MCTPACACVAAVIANMRGNSPEEVAATLMAQPGLQGLQGPTISPVYGPGKQRYHQGTPLDTLQLPLARLDQPNRWQA